MKRALLALLCLSFSAAHAQTARRPKLVLTIVVDQFRYDYLTRFRADYNGGFATLMNKGAFFTDARYPQFPTVTAVGHSMIMSGATPSVSGIVGNTWYDRDDKRVVTSVCDGTVTVIGAAHPAVSPTADCNDTNPSSPRRFLVDTVGDELKIASPNSRIIGVSLKGRSAILPAGHLATGAYWFDDSGVFVTSSYYCNELPKWAADYNKANPTHEFEGKEWMGIHFETGAKLIHQIPASPWGNELIESFAEAAIEGEKLGQRNVTDVLTVSFSSNDYVGHQFGPDDVHVHDMALRTDHLLDRLFHYIDARGIGMANTLVVLSADHGVAPLPETNKSRMPGGRISANEITGALEAALTARFGPGDWLIKKPIEYVIYLNHETIREHKLDPADVNRVAAEALSAHPNVFRVYTREQLASGVTGDRIAQAMTDGYFPRRSGDLFVLLDPYWLPGATGTTHGTPFSYDNHVPLIFMGPGVRPGRYHESVAITDVAPTLADLLEVETPSGSVGRVLSEMVSDNH